MNFIGKWFLEDKTVCDNLINFFNVDDFARAHKHQGRLGDDVQIHTEMKKSTDLPISPQDYDEIECISNYLTELQKVCQKYIEKYEWCNKFDPWYIAEGFNIQYYGPNDGYYCWHTERDSSTFPTSSRHLVFMTYLNDVEDGGETEWYHQKLKVKPKKGLTLIWPADWTHVHRGIPSGTQEKYIATGWYNFLRTY
jgi:hypothetical protein